MNEVRPYVVIRLSAHEFETWLVNGLYRFTAVHHWSNRENDPQSAFHENGDWIFAVLPSKYSEPLYSQHGIYGLIDDVLQLSCVDSAQTEELRVRLHTLGETWLPVVFAPEVVMAQKQQPMGMPLGETISTTVPEHNARSIQEPELIKQATLDLVAADATSKVANKRGRRATAISPETQASAKKPSRSRRGGREKRGVESSETLS